MQVLSQVEVMLISAAMPINNVYLMVSTATVDMSSICLKIFFPFHLLFHDCHHTGIGARQLNLLKINLYFLDCINLIIVYLDYYKFIIVYFCVCNLITPR